MAAAASEAVSVPIRLRLSIAAITSTSVILTKNTRQGLDPSGAGFQSVAFNQRAAVEEVDGH